MGNQSIVPGVHSGIHPTLAVTPYVVSEDVGILVFNWIKSKYCLILPSQFFDDFLSNLRKRMRERLSLYFPRIEFISEEEITRGMNNLIERDSYEIVSLDGIYFRGDGFHLEVTRLLGEDGEISPDLGSRNTESVGKQIGEISDFVRKPIQLVDDVIYTAGNILKIIEKFREKSVNVALISAGVLTEKGLKEIKKNFPEVLVNSVKFYEHLVDEVCERDFYAGIPQSGILMGKNGLPFYPERGAPYFLPFGSPQERASISPENVLDWSRFCFDNSILLWQEIEIFLGETITCEEIPRLPRFMERNDSSFIEALKKLRP